MARALSNPEVQALFNDLPEVYGRAIAHDTFVRANGWNQVAWALRADLPIPVRGLTVNDPAIGTVIVFADSRGVLHYTLAQSANEQSLAVQIQKPEFQSPTVSLLDQLNAMIAGANAGLGSWLNFSVVVLVIVLGLALYQTLRT